MPIHFPYHVVCWLFCLMGLWGCGTHIGPETADGAYLDFSGDVVNYYSGPPDVTVQAGLQALQAMRVPVDGKLEEDGQTLILAAAPDGSAIRVRFVSEGRDLTAVKVRTGLTGYWDREFSHQLHISIREQLKRSTRSAPTTPQNRPQPAQTAGTGPVIARGSRSDRPEKRPAVPATLEKGSPKDAIPSEKPRASVSERAASSSLGAQPAAPPSMPAPHAAVYFEEDSNLPGPGEMAKLEALAVQLSDNPSWSASLVGFAGGGENDGRPRMVAESRVLAVKFYLVGKGIAPERLATRAGEYEGGFKASDTRVSRRVDIHLMKGP